MMNRPRPRKIVSVIKSSPSAEEISEKELNGHIKPAINKTENNFTSAPVANGPKPSSPSVPPFSNTRPTDTKPQFPSNASGSFDSTGASSFSPRKPVVTTLKKAHFPPPPTFSESPKSSPIPFNKPEKTPEPSQSFSQSQTKPLSPKSSGEAFLDAADKAADFIGGALLNSFKSFNLTDTTPVRLSPSLQENKAETEDDPFADIMKKLKAPKQTEEPEIIKINDGPIKPAVTNLIDEEPPSSFNDFGNDDFVPKSPKENVFKHQEQHSDDLFNNNDEILHQASDSEITQTDKEIIGSILPTTVVNSIEEIIGEDETVYINNNQSNIVSHEIPEYSYEAKDIKEFKLPDDIVNNDIATNVGKVFNENVLPLQKEQSLAPLGSTEVEEDLFQAPIVKSEPIVDAPVPEVTVVQASVPETKTVQTPAPYVPPATANTVPVFNFDGSVSSGSPDSLQNNSPTKSFGAINVPSNSSTSSIPFFDSLSSIVSTNSDANSSVSPNSPSSPRTGGFRASILKHGLSALEKIGKSTADVVVSTRNKLSEQPSIIPQAGQVITPDYTDESSSFYDILKVYGGYSKLQELQLKGVRASISMKLARKSDKNIIKTSSFDYQTRLRLQREIAGTLHPDRIMESIDDSNTSNLILVPETEFSRKFPQLFKCYDEVYCIQKLLKSLDNILIVNGPNVDESALISSNRRRHVICQISTVFCSLLQQLSGPADELSREISTFTAQIVKYLQINFARNCEDYSRADRDQQIAIKLFLDISYSIVPSLQQNLLTQ